MADTNHFIWEAEDMEGMEITNPSDEVQATIDRIDALLSDDVVDAAPSSLYVSRKVLNGDEVRKWFSVQGLTDLLDAADLHVTLAYSTTPVDWMEMGQPWDEKIEIVPGGPRIVEVFGEGHIVQRFASSALQWRHDEFKERGASWDWASYAPHITVARGTSIPDGLKPYTGRILLGPEIFEEIKNA